MLQREASLLRGQVFYLWPGGRSQTWQVYNQVENTIKWESKLPRAQSEPKNYQQQQQQQQESAQEQCVPQGTSTRDRAGPSSAIRAAPLWLLQPSRRKGLDSSSSPSLPLSLSVWKETA